MTVRRWLRRHRSTLGRPIEVHRSRPGILTLLVLVTMWSIAPIGVLVNPDPDLLANLVFPVIWGAILLAALVMMSGEVLVVCEQGVLVGSIVPFQRPCAIPYSQITPGSVVPVTRARKFSATTGRFYPTATTRTGWWVSTAVAFVGPSPDEARGKPLGPRGGSGLRSVDGRWFWFVGTGRRRPDVVTQQIGHAAGRAGLHRLADATLAAPPRALNGARADAARLLPGYPDRR